MLRLRLLIICLVSGTCLASAQGIISGLDKEQYAAKVKLLDEFFDRFNGDESRSDMPEEYNTREANLLLLFDLYVFSSREDSAFVAANEFAECVVKSNTRLTFNSPEWYAHVTCTGKLQGKGVTFCMYLCVEEDSLGMRRWAISNVEGEIFATSQDWPHKKLSIMPNDNEQFFQSIKRITTETHEFIDDYVRSDYHADALDTFLALVRCNNLTITAVSNVQFSFLQVPDYLFTVSYVSRETNNAGWLITQCRKCTYEEKDEIKKIVRL